MKVNRNLKEGKKLVEGVTVEKRYVTNQEAAFMGWLYAPKGLETLGIDPKENFITDEGEEMQCSIITLKGKENAAFRAASTVAVETSSEDSGNVEWFDDEDETTVYVDLDSNIIYVSSADLMIESDLSSEVITRAIKEGDYSTLFARRKWRRV